MAKIYVKRGAPNAREHRLVSQIQKAIDAEKAKNPDYVFDKSCKTFEELRELHKQMCTEEVAFEEVKTSTLDFGDKKKETKVEDADVITEKKAKDINKVDEKDAYTDDDGMIDPFNRANPIVRDYVTDSKSMDRNPVNEAVNNDSGFGEPINFDDAFDIPDDSDSEDGGKKTKGGKAVAEKKPKKPRSRKEAPEPVNPDFANMSAAKQKKNTKLFAKYIVEAVCTLAERGFIYFANSDISEAKLVEYEVNNEMDLSLLLTLEDGQQVTVKRWFLAQNIKAEELSHIDQESRDELAEALGDVLLEKGFAPTPMQSLMIVAGKIFLVDKGLKLLELKMQTNSVLTQLRSMANGGAQGEYEEEAVKSEINKEVVENGETTGESEATAE